jgi:RNA 2',3'-cyclic 3'-phosphodiesterase
VVSGAHAEAVIRSSSTARLFVAVDPPEDVCHQLVEWGRSATRAGEGRVRANASLRVLDSELLHVTLCFLGNRPVEEIDMLAAQLTAHGGPSGRLSLGAPLWLPARHPRALAVELHDEDGRLARLQAELVAALEQLRGWQPSVGGRGGESASKARAGRRFRPHITVARMRPASASYERVLPPTPSLSFVPRELVLYRSWLSPEGASYEAVASHPIG